MVPLDSFTRTRSILWSGLRGLAARGQGDKKPTLGHQFPVPGSRHGVLPESRKSVCVCLSLVHGCEVGQIVVANWIMGLS